MQLMRACTKIMAMAMRGYMRWEEDMEVEEVTDNKEVMEAADEEEVEAMEEVDAEEVDLEDTEALDEEGVEDMEALDEEEDNKEAMEAAAEQAMDNRIKVKEDSTEDSHHSKEECHNSKTILLVVMVAEEVEAGDSKLEEVRYQAVQSSRDV